MKINPSQLADAARQASVERRQQSLPVEIERRASAANEDRAEFSHAARARELRAELEKVPEERSERIAQLRDAIRTGRYEVNAETLADAILRDFGTESLR